MAESESLPPFSSYFTFSGRNVAISGASLAVAGYLLYRGELDESMVARAVLNVSQATLTGANIWHTTSSTALFKRVPRHTFALVQAKLFPDYFTMLHGVSGLALCLYLAQSSQQHHHVQKFRLTCLTISHVTSGLNAIFLGPTLSKLNAECVEMEKEAGVGQQEGVLTPEEKKKVAEKNPLYRFTYRRFAMLHGISVLFAMLGYACNIATVAVSEL